MSSISNMTNETASMTQEVQQRQIPFGTVQKHASVGDCWLVVNGTVYDASELIKMYPGGSDLILREAGKDASQPLAVLNSIELRNGSCSGTNLELSDPTNAPLLTDEQRQRARRDMPSVEKMVLLQDFEFWAHAVLSNVGWAYYRSAADLERSYFGSMEALRRYSLRPRMLRDMSNGSTKTTWMEFPSELPIYISPAAMAKLGHQLGEVNLTKAAGDYGVVQGVSANTSVSLEEVFDAKRDTQILLYQIYIDKVRSKSVEILQKVERLGAKAIILTADVGWESKRTMEARIDGFELPKESLGAFMASGGLQDRKLSFDDISWIHRYTKLPVIVKGILSIEDIELCVKHGAKGVMISNHGGRQLDYGPAPIDVLYELRTYRPDLFDKIDIMVDGGVRTGADVVKLLALGAKAVGLGRTFLYANATHGEEGVRRVFDILRQEITNTMRNVGAATIGDLKPEMVGPAGAWVGPNRPSYWKV